MEGDEEEDDVDDLENEFNFEAGRGARRGTQAAAAAAEAMLQSHLSYGRTTSDSLSDLPPHDLHPMPQIPLLTNGQMVMLSQCFYFSSLMLSILLYKDLVCILVAGG